jgi:putative transcription antitermination factor YqgF
MIKPDAVSDGFSGPIIQQIEEAGFKIIALKKIIADEDINCLVLGVPYFLDGRESSLTKKIKIFGQKLQGHFPEIPVELQDETLSTFEAQSRMKTSIRYNFKVDMKQIDALAASIILEDYMKIFQERIAESETDQEKKDSYVYNNEEE